MLNVERQVCSWHLNQLRASGFISKKFATMRSDRLARALRYYKSTSLSPGAVGRRFGYKNFYSLLNYQKKRGIAVERTPNFPIPLVLEQESPPMNQTLS
jgi:hypothetical protein